MEKRLGIIAIVIEHQQSVMRVNALLSEFSHLIDARLGLPLRGKGISLISLVVEGDTDDLGSLTGKLGRVDGVKVKSVLTTYKEDGNDPHQGTDA